MSTTPVANLPPVSLIPLASGHRAVDTGGKFAAGIDDTGGKFATGINNTSNWWQNLPPVSVIPVAILPPVSLTPVANLPPVSLIPVVNLKLRISPRIFEKIRNGPNGILKSLGETDS